MATLEIGLVDLVVIVVPVNAGIGIPVHRAQLHIAAPLVHRGHHDHIGKRPRIQISVPGIDTEDGDGPVARTQIGRNKGPGHIADQHRQQQEQHQLQEGMLSPAPSSRAGASAAAAGGPASRLPGIPAGTRLASLLRSCHRPRIDKVLLICLIIVIQVSLFLILVIFISLMVSGSGPAAAGPACRTLPAPSPVIRIFSHHLTPPCRVIIAEEAHKKNPRKNSGGSCSYQSQSTLFLNTYALPPAACPSPSSGGPGKNVHSRPASC